MNAVQCPTCKIDTIPPTPGRPEEQGHYCESCGVAWDADRLHAPATEARTCHNCGRPQNHRWHDRRGPGLLLANGCPYSMAKPETLWDAVLWPAIAAAAQAHGVAWEQAHAETWDRVARSYQRWGW